MKIGILTFHSQLNYGGVLQCWALVQVLRGLGHQVVVIDRWLDESSRRLDGPFSSFNIKCWTKIVIDSINGNKAWKMALRHWRTRKFVRAMGFTDFHFHQWADAPNDLKIDCIIVGSDQVWHGGDWGDPRPYLLEGAPRIKAIAYAASFGMTTLPREYNYAAGFSRFLAISVREKEAVRLVEALGFDATCVLDPTLLLNPECWFRLAQGERQKNTVACYIIAEDLCKVVPILEAWATNNNRVVELLCDSMPKLQTCKIKESKHLKFRFSYGPTEFIALFARASECITDSFHALMFSTIYNCNVRFIRPSCTSRAKMFSRISEYVSKNMVGSVIVNNVSDALNSFDRNEKVKYLRGSIDRERLFSMQWLNNALDSCRSKEDDNGCN